MCVCGVCVCRVPARPAQADNVEAVVAMALAPTRKCAPPAPPLPIKGESR